MWGRPQSSIQFQEEPQIKSQFFSIPTMFALITGIAIDFVSHVAVAGVIEFQK